MHSGIDTAIAHLLSACGSLRAGENVLIVADDSTRELAPAFVAQARAAGAQADCAWIPVASRHGQEPPAEVAAQMAQADLILGLTKMSLAHTRARQAATAGRGRYLSLPGYCAAMLADPAVTVDYKGQFELTYAVAQAFSAGRRVRVETRAGTALQLEIDGRAGNCCPGFVDADWRLGSPPDIEANVSPLEDRSNGVIVVDGSVACDEIGLLQAPITLRVAGGRIVEVSSTRADYVAQVQALFARVGDPKAYVLAECGVGLNPAAQLTGNMLTDEGALGCVHFGFGSNATVGGANDVPFHVDFVLRAASLWVDEQPVLQDGVPCLPDTRAQPPQ